MEKKISIYIEIKSNVIERKWKSKQLREKNKNEECMIKKKIITIQRISIKKSIYLNLFIFHFSYRLATLFYFL